MNYIIRSYLNRYSVFNFSSSDPSFKSSWYQQQIKENSQEKEENESKLLVKSQSQKPEENSQEPEENESQLLVNSQSQEKEENQENNNNQHQHSEHIEINNFEENDENQNIWQKTKGFFSTKIKKIKGFFSKEEKTNNADSDVFILEAKQTEKVDDDFEYTKTMFQYMNQEDVQKLTKLYFKINKKNNNLEDNITNAIIDLIKDKSLTKLKNKTEIKNFLLNKNYDQCVIQHFFEMDKLGKNIIKKVKKQKAITIHELSYLLIYDTEQATGGNGVFIDVEEQQNLIEILNYEEIKPLFINSNVIFNFKTNTQQVENLIGWKKDNSNTTSERLDNVNIIVKNSDQNYKQLQEKAKEQGINLMNKKDFNKTEKMYDIAFQKKLEKFLFLESDCLVQPEGFGEEEVFSQENIFQQTKKSGLVKNPEEDVQSRDEGSENEEPEEQKQNTENSPKYVPTGEVGPHKTNLFSSQNQFNTLSHNQSQKNYTINNQQKNAYMLTGEMYSNDINLPSGQDKFNILQHNQSQKNYTTNNQLYEQSNIQIQTSPLIKSMINEIKDLNAKKTKIEIALKNNEDNHPVLITSIQEKITKNNEELLILHNFQKLFDSLNSSIMVSAMSGVDIKFFSPSIEYIPKIKSEDFKSTQEALRVFKPRTRKELNDIYGKIWDLNIVDDAIKLVEIDQEKDSILTIMGKLQTYLEKIKENQYIEMCIEKIKKVKKNYFSKKDRTLFDNLVLRGFSLYGFLVQLFNFLVMISLVSSLVDVVAYCFFGYENLLMIVPGISALYSIAQFFIIVSGLSAINKIINFFLEDIIKKDGSLVKNNQHTFILLRSAWVIVAILIDFFVLEPLFGVAGINLFLNNLLNFTINGAMLFPGDISLFVFVYMIVVFYFGLSSLFFDVVEKLFSNQNHSKASSIIPNIKLINPCVVLDNSPQNKKQRLMDKLIELSDILVHRNYLNGMIAAGVKNNKALANGVQFLSENKILKNPNEASGKLFRYTPYNKTDSSNNYEKLISPNNYEKLTKNAYQEIKNKFGVENLYKVSLREQLSTINGDIPVFCVYEIGKNMNETLLFTYNEYYFSFGDTKQKFDYNTTMLIVNTKLKNIIVPKMNEFMHTLQDFYSAFPEDEMFKKNFSFFKFNLSEIKESIMNKFNSFKPKINFFNPKESQNIEDQENNTNIIEKITCFFSNLLNLNIKQKMEYMTNRFKEIIKRQEDKQYDKLFSGETIKRQEDKQYDKYDQINEFFENITKDNTDQVPNFNSFKQQPQELAPTDINLQKSTI